MDKEKLLQLIHCKLKDSEAKFIDLKKDLGFILFIDLFGTLKLTHRILYRKAILLERLFCHYEKIPYKTIINLEIDYAGYEKINFILTVEEFNEINVLIHERINLADKEKLKRLEKEITKELENCK